MAAVVKERCGRALERFLNEYTPAAPTLVVSGGVAANTAIRGAVDDLCEAHGFRSYAPPLNLCGDNAAMIAWAGVERLRLGEELDDHGIRPRWPLDLKSQSTYGSGRRGAKV